MNENEQAVNIPVTDTPSEDTENTRSLNLVNETIVKENGDVPPTTTQVAVGEQTPDVITVPPDTSEALRNCLFDNCEQAELVVETPDGQERRFICSQPLDTVDIRKILYHVCRSVGINETMEAVIPEFLDNPSSDDPKSDELDSQELVVQTNGMSSSDKEDCHTYILTKRSVCPVCGCVSQDSRCHKCRRKLSTTVHIISAGKSAGTELILKKKSDLKEGDSKKRKCQRKHKKFEEPVCLTISSDEEESDSSKKQCSQNGIGSEENVVTEVRKKEPNITEETESPEEAMTRGVAGGGMDFSELLDCPDLEKALLQCRTVRIGSYKVVPEEKVVISEYGIKMKVPSPKGESVTIKILRNEIVKVLVHFGKSMPVLFYYTTNRAGIKVRNTLKMPHKMDSIYFDPTSKVEMHKRIILFPDKLTEETRLFIKSVYDTQCLLEDLNSQEADEILLRVAPKDIPQQPKKDNLQNTSSAAMTASNIQTIMVYPPPPLKGGISINTEDYACLGEDQFLNDVIIDFYLKFIVQTSLSEFDQKRTHVFSSFFYKRLTTKCTPHGGGNKYQDDPKLNAAEKRHARVKGWTKSVDLFSKDFIIIPINENSHWFLGIICFPGLTSAVRMSDNSPIANPARRKPKAGNMTVLSGGQAPATIGATTITMVHPVAEPTITLEADDEDRDEAEGDDDDLEPNTSDEESNKDSSEELLDEATHKIPKATKPPSDLGEPIKQPCILIFDSLAGASRSRVCATLREYLEVEYKVRHKGRKRDFSKDTIRGAVPKVPQQTNYTDCGLYVLQYVETFFQKPITNYRMPIKMLKDWFTPEVVSRKRYEIQQLLHRLMEEQNVDISRLNLPNLGLHPDGTSSHLPFSDGEDEELDEEEAEMEGELDETLEEEMNMDEEMDMDMGEGGPPSEEDDNVGGLPPGGRNSSISERSNEYFVDKTSNFPFRHIDTSTLPCKIEQIGMTDVVQIKRKSSTLLKDLRSPRVVSNTATTITRQPLTDSKRMRCD
ncbi:sentrin-specific protease 6-like isoform X2 [Rhodnius prolixus]